MKPEPAATFDRKSGSLSWRGMWRSPADLERQAQEFERIAGTDDYFASAAAELAKDCRDALSAYERHHHRKAA